MSRQERLARRQALAAKRAARVVEEATERVVAARPSAGKVREAAEALAEWVDHGTKVKAADNASPPPPPQDPELATAQEVKRLRDEGQLSWMAIGAKLGLPGSKSGAGSARRYYAMVNQGEVPRSQAPRKGSTPKPSGPASRGVPAYLRKERLVRDGHVIPRDTPDEEVEAMLVGRRIEWAVDLAALTQTDPATWGPEDKRWKVEEARVHVDPQWVKVVPDDRWGRVVYFREYAGYDTDRRRHMSGPTRVVKVDAIYTVA